MCRCGAGTAMAQEDDRRNDEAGVPRPFFPGGEGDPTASYGSAAMRPGAQIGPYRLLGILGEGGYGIVYLAEQERRRSAEAQTMVKRTSLARSLARA